MESARKRRFADALLLQFPENEFNMLARPLIVRRKIRASTKIFTCTRATNCHPIAIAVLRVGHLEVREHRLVAEILEFEGLRAPKLASQLGLPGLDVHAHRTAQMGHRRFMGNPADFACADLAQLPRIGGLQSARHVNGPSLRSCELDLKPGSWPPNSSASSRRSCRASRPTFPHASTASRVFDDAR